MEGKVNDMLEDLSMGISRMLQNDLRKKGKAFWRKGRRPVS